MPRIKEIFQNIWRMRTSALILALLLFALECVWYYSSNRYIASHIVDIGVLFSTDTDNMYKPIESLDNLDRFIHNGLLIETGLASNCSALVAYTGKYVVKMSCSGVTAEDSVKNLNKLTEPLLERHQNFINLIETIAIREEEEQLLSLERLSSRIKNLPITPQKDNYFSYLLYDRRLTIENSYEDTIKSIEKKKFIRKNNKASSIKADSFLLKHRLNGFKALLAGFFIAVFASFFLIFSISYGKLLRKESVDFKNE